MQLDVIAEAEQRKKRHWQLTGSGGLLLVLGSACLIYGQIRPASADMQ